MDGSQSLFAEVKDADEAARQADVYQRAMASIRRDRLARERSGQTVLAVMTSTGPKPEGGMVKAAKLLLIAFTCVMPVIAFWAIAL